jgi:hypothetical protein
MTSSSFLRKIAFLLLLGVLLGSPWAAAAGPRSHPETRIAGGRLGDVLVQAWRALTAFLGDNGCSADPSGRCGSAAVTPIRPADALDNGCSLDPSGGCDSAASTPIEPADVLDNGCSADPNGGCRAGR